MNRAVVLIISHKSELHPFEQISLRQCLSILGKHPIRLLCPIGLDVGAYRAIVPDIPIDFIDSRWESSYEMFNALKVSPFLYDRYAQFDYILFYEPDAFVFSDELMAWCDRGFDYVGAPWFDGYGHPRSDHLIGVGNGGFSLRKVESHRCVAHRFQWERALFRGHPRHVRDRLDYLFGRLPYFMAPFEANEDTFWGFRARRRLADFKVATPAEAVPFSFEARPRELFERNGRRLPFGCHAWFKGDLEFWKPFVERFGYELGTENRPEGSPASPPTGGSGSR